MKYLIKCQYQTMNARGEFIIVEKEFDRYIDLDNFFDKNFFSKNYIILDNIKSTSDLVVIYVRIM